MLKGLLQRTANKLQLLLQFVSNWSTASSQSEQRYSAHLHVQ